MAITAIGSVSADAEEYGRYGRYTGEADTGVIAATVAATGADGDTVHLDLIDARRGRVVASKTTTLGGGTASAQFDLERDCADADGVYRARQGHYRLRASSAPGGGGVAGQSPPLRVAIVTAAELRDRWLPTVSLTIETDLVPTVTHLAGVVGLGTRSVQRGGYPIQWRATARKLSFDGGPEITVPPSGAAYAVDLWSRTLDQTVTLRLTPGSLPGADTLGYLFADFAEIADRQLRGWIDDGYAAAEAFATVPLEPREVCTARLRAAYPHAEEVVPGAAFDAGVRRRTRQVAITTGQRRALAVHALSGWSNGQTLVTYPAAWIGLDPFSGTILVTPGVGPDYPAPTPATAGLLGFPGAFGAPRRLEEFWQFALTHGLADLHHGDGAALRQAVARFAAVQALLVAGRAQRGISGSDSFSRDGTSFSHDFTNGQWGIYSDYVGEHLTWLWQNMGKRLRNHVAGIMVAR